MPLLFLGFFLFSCGSSPKDDAAPDLSGSAPVETGSVPPQQPAEETRGNLPVSPFRELWGYVVAGQESSLRASLPLTDVAYFGAELDSYGKLVNIPSRRLLASWPGRVHVVVASNGRSLTHFALEPGSRTRRELVADLIAASRSFDGLQIDFESVPARDGDNFRSFLEELRRSLPAGKMFTIALPARTRTIDNDVYDYRKILPFVDRIFVMAYDEHWSTSAPGPIASVEWCRNVASYSLSVTGREKLIMGLPFYGRTWGNINPNRAFYYSGIQRIRNENSVTQVERVGSIPTFRYETRLVVTAWYEDSLSLSTKLEMYRSLGVRSVGFWSIGQETPEIWSLLAVN